MFSTYATAQSRFSLLPIKLLVLTASLIAATPALAASTSSASLSNLQISLIDLDVNDGITPYITWIQSEGNFYSQGVARLSDANVGSLGENQFNADGAYATGNTAAGYSASFTSASISGNGEFIGTSIEASGNSDDIGLSYESYASVGIQNYLNTATFSLSPNTRAIVSGAAGSSSDTTFSPTETNSANTYGRLYAYTSGGSFLTGIEFYSQSFQSGDPLYVGAVNYYYSFYDYSTSFQDYSYDTSSFNRGFSLNIDNASSDELAGVLYGSVNAYGSSIAVAAVPEPEAYAMLLGGLGLVGFAARRRRQS